jgi:hypothetical protein
MLVRILTNLKDQAETKKFSKPYNWTAISKMLQNTTGQSLDYDSFKSEVDANPNLQNLFHNFDDQGITFIKPVEIKTAVAAKKANAQAAVNSSAKRAAGKLLNK